MATSREDKSLLAAAFVGSVDEMKEALLAGANCDAVTLEKRSSLHYCCARGDLAGVTLLLGEGADPNCFDADKTTPLHVAADNGRSEIVELLLGDDWSVNVNATTLNQHATPLHLATIKAHIPCIRLLLDAGADIHKLDSWGKSPLHYGSQGNVALAAMFCEQAAESEDKMSAVKHSGTHLNAPKRPLPVPQKSFKRVKLGLSRTTPALPSPSNTLARSQTERIIKVRLVGEECFKRIKLTDLTHTTLVAAARQKLGVDEASEVKKIVELPDVAVSDDEDVSLLSHDASIEFTFVKAD